MFPDLFNVPKTYRRYYVAYDRVQRHIQELRHVSLESAFRCRSAGVVSRAARMMLASELTNSDIRIVIEASFRDLLQDEIKRVNQFALIKEQEITMEIQRIARGLSTLAGGSNRFQTAVKKEAKRRIDEILPEQTGRADGKLNGRNREMLARFELEIDEQSMEIVHLDHFIRVNYAGFVDLQKEYDEAMGTTTVQWFMASLVKEDFCSVNIDGLLVLLSLCWERFRLVKAHLFAESSQCSDAATDTTWRPPESFIRKTTKYWVAPENVVRTKAAILRYVPYLIFGQTAADLEVFLDPFVLAADQKRCIIESPNESQLVTSVYFDSIDAYSYNLRLMRLEGAFLIRFRWYGDNSGESNKEIYVEKKTHHESWTQLKSTKERFVLPQRNIFPFMKGKLNIDDELNPPVGNKDNSKRIALAKHICEITETKKLQPMVRTSYLRAAFQLATSNEVRFSIDTNLCMVDECILKNHPNEPWCRVGEEVLGKDEVVRFPYAVLEVKLQTDQPEWVSDLLVDSEAIAVYKFSKFQHGMAFLHRDIISPYGTPHWIRDFERRGYVLGFSAPGSPKHRMRLLSNRTTSIISIPVNKPLSNNRITDKQFSSSDDTGTDASQFPSKAVDGDVCSNWSPRARRSTEVKARIEDTNVNRYQRTVRPFLHRAQMSRQNKTYRVMKLKSKNVRRLDPKSQFAAERTFLHYVQKGLYLSVLITGITFIARTNLTKRIVCLLLCVSANSLFIYALCNFFSRVKKIDSAFTNQRKEEAERIDSSSGPLILFTAVMSLLTVAFFLNLSGVHSSFHHIKVAMFDVLEKTLRVKINAHFM